MGYPIWFIQIITNEAGNLKEKQSAIKSINLQHLLIVSLSTKNLMSMNELFGVIYEKLRWKKKKFNLL